MLYIYTYHVQLVLTRVLKKMLRTYNYILSDVSTDSFFSASEI